MSMPDKAATHGDKFAVVFGAIRTRTPCTSEPASVESGPPPRWG